MLSKRAITDCVKLDALASSFCVIPLLRLCSIRLALFTHAKTEEMYRVKELYTAYREVRGTDTDSLWDIMSLLSFVYDTARIQGIREERARRT